MGRGKLTEDEIRILSENPNVREVLENRILYTEEFKKHFMKEYTEHKKGPTQIFREAGFDIAILGSKRVERAAARWKESYAANSLGVHEDGTLRHRRKEEERKKEIRALKAEVRMLRKQLQSIKELL